MTPDTQANRNTIDTPKHPHQSNRVKQYAAALKQRHEYQPSSKHHVEKQLWIVSSSLNDLPIPRTLPHIRRRADLLLILAKTYATIYGPPDTTNTRVNLTLVSTMRQLADAAKTNGITLDADGKSMLSQGPAEAETGDRPPFDEASLSIDPPSKNPPKIDFSATAGDIGTGEG
jgi:hypothetical protein